VAGVTISPATFSYGDHPAQSADLYSPGTDGLVPVVVLVHGGYWRTPYDRTLMVPLAEDLVSRGYAVWNIEYRRVGNGGGGDDWRVTFDDVTAALELLSDIGAEHGVDLDRIAAVGHSAGGHLALWLASEFELSAVVSQAGIANLYDAYKDRLSPGTADKGYGVVGVPAVAELLGGHPGSVGSRYAEASPSALLPLGAPVLVLHGDADDVVPITQSRDFVDAAREAGDRVKLAVIPGMGHFELTDPGHESWKRTVEFLERHLDAVPDAARDAVSGAE
jgi:acetyl esterase/lipase